MATRISSIRLPPASGSQYIKPAPVYDVTKFPDERTQHLRALLQKGHVTVAPLRDPKLILHSHLPHFLGSAYALGAGIDQLTRSYENEILHLIPISRGFLRGNAISKESWRKFLGQKEYTVAFVDFFEEQVKAHNGDWAQVLADYLYSGSEPIINGFTGGLGHPFIHLAYAYEFNCKEIATEALSQGCTEYSPVHTLLDHPPRDNSTYKTISLAEIIEQVRNDCYFDGLLTEPGILNLEVLYQEQHLDVIQKHWSAWEVVDLLKQFEECCDLSVLLALSTGNPKDSFDFYLAHVMTVAHALRVLWHFSPPERHESILRQYALFTIMTYICQLRPKFALESIETVPLEGRNWNWVINNSLGNKSALDVHFFKVVRAPLVFEETFGRKDDFYLKAAIKYITEFRGWEGYGIGIEGFVPSRDGTRWPPESD
ncbi:hypothetical protein TCE0_060f19254 [Talaromyces pinophilus]|uniref:Uncharacterized protein n=1 Tax=Talaromyces pinophilus TaxID=128442 RepID=A0A6V8HQH7_TALPI|nr:hypothetical protein TCE0_060f19254 [Talaromyces pinophilus]